MKKLALIAAIGKHRAIGRAGKIPWSLPDDMRRFKELTMGRPIIMGRRTFESIGRCLPGRANVVLSRDPAKAASSAVVKNRQPSLGASLIISPTFENALERAYDIHDEPFIIGGADIYRMALPLVTRMEITGVDLDVPGADAFFPEEAAGMYDAFRWTVSGTSTTLSDDVPWLLHEGVRYQFTTAVRRCVEAS